MSASMTKNRQNDLQEMTDAFHMWAWNCISEWAFVDEELFLIFINCFDHLLQSAIIYFRTPDQKVRLGLTHALVMSALREKGQRDDYSNISAWKEAITSFDDLLDVRRRISHLPIFPRKIVWDGAVVGHMGFDAAALGSGGTPTSSVRHESGREQICGDDGDHSPLKLQDLQDHLTEVKALGERLRTFLHDVLIPHVRRN
jgi:hypothetical protein